MSCSRPAPTPTSPRRVKAQWGDLAALVRKQKEMLGDIGRRTRELASLSAFLQTHYEQEKARLARQLHDELGGILTPAKMDLSWLESRLGGDAQYRERMARLAALIDQGIDLKRRMIEELRPSLLDHLGLAAAVQWYVDEVCGAAKMESRVTVSKLERLSPDLEIALYRIVQESVINAVRHSRATRIELVVERTPQGVKRLRPRQRRRHRGPRPRAQVVARSGRHDAPNASHQRHVRHLQPKGRRDEGRKRASAVLFSKFKEIGGASDRFRSSSRCAGTEGADLTAGKLGRRLIPHHHP